MPSNTPLSNTEGDKEELHRLASFIVDFEFENPAHLHMNRLTLIEKYEAMIQAYINSKLIEELEALRMYNSTIAVHSGTDSLQPPRYIEAIPTKHLDEKLFELKATPNKQRNEEDER